MFSLRQQVGSSKHRVGCFVGNKTNFRRTGWHVYSHIVQGNLLLGSHDKLVARTENLINLRHALRTVSHGSDSLNATRLKNLAYARNLCRHEDSRVHLALFIRRSTQYYFFTSRNLGRSSQHQNGAKERSSTSRDIQSHLLYSHTLLPAGYTRASFNLYTFKLLAMMECGNVMMGEVQSVFQFLRNHFLCLFDFSFSHSQRIEMGMIKLLLVTLHGFVAMVFHIVEYTLYGRIQLRNIQVWAFYNLAPFLLCRILYYLHSYY